MMSHAVPTAERFSSAPPKPRGLPATQVRGRGGKVLQAERGQMFPEDVAQLARWRWRWR